MAFRGSAEISSASKKLICGAFVADGGMRQRRWVVARGRWGDAAGSASAGSAPPPSNRDNMDHARQVTMSFHGRDGAKKEGSLPPGP